MNRYRTTMRRTRIHPALREMLAGVRVVPAQLMYPMFIVPGSGVREPVTSMPGVFRQSADQAAAELKLLVAQGLRAVMLFGVIPDGLKDKSGSHALAADSVVAGALKRLKAEFPDVLFAVDLCFCEYTDHGHCGILDEKTTVENHSTVINLGRQAVALAKAGADMIAPSGMMDGMVDGIRTALDDTGFEQIPVMAYSVKYASGFYGPFRDAAGSAPSHGDRRQYQQDPRRGHGEAMAEALADLDQGADILMVKPGMAYLDVLATLKAAELDVPLAVYNVSGEYAMLKAAAANGWIDHDRVLAETMTAFGRAGADIIITYSAPDVLRLMKPKGYI